MVGLLQNSMKQFTTHIQTEKNIKSNFKKEFFCQRFECWEVGTVTDDFQSEEGSYREGSVASGLVLGLVMVEFCIR